MSVERSRPYPGSSHASSKRSVGIVVALFISCGGLGVSSVEEEYSLEVVDRRPKLCVQIIPSLFAPNGQVCEPRLYTKILCSLLAQDPSIRPRQRHLTPPPLVHHFPNVRVGSGQKNSRKRCKINAAVTSSLEPSPENSHIYVKKIDNRHLTPPIRPPAGIMIDLVYIVVILIE